MGIAGLLLAGLSAAAVSEQADAVIGAADLMRGFPPPAELRVTAENQLLPPFNRWSLQHVRELQPTRAVWRGDAAVSRLPAELQALGEFSAPVRGGREVTIDTWLTESHTDAFLVLHEGRIIFERYMNDMRPEQPHLLFSATKSFVGTLMLMLVDEGRIDRSARVDHYVPELADSAFGDATVGQVLDMTTGLAFDEIYDDPESEVVRYSRVFGLNVAAGGERPSIYEYLPSLRKEGDHGSAFHYVTPNTDVLAWIIRRATGQSVDALISERFWQPMGMERDGYFWLDGGGTEFAGGGFNITARDAARFGAMILAGGRWNGRQILPAAVTRQILAAGDPAIFLARYGALPGSEWYGTIAHSYHDQWWRMNNAHGAVTAIGIHGQYLYLDPVARMVVVKFSSSPTAEGGPNESNDTDGPLLYQALGEYLVRQGERNQAGQ